MRQNNSGTWLKLSVFQRETGGWLPSRVSHRTIQVSFKSHLPSLTFLHRRETKLRIKQGTPQVVSEWQRLLDDGAVKNRAELARRVGVSRARITQALQHT